MTPEAKVKKRISAILTSVGAWYFMPIGGAYSRAGIPDFVGCLSGRFFAIEAKAGKGRTTALQEKEISLIKHAGGFALVVNEKNIEELEPLLRQWREHWTF